MRGHVRTVVAVGAVGVALLLAFGAGGSTAGTARANAVPVILGSDFPQITGDTSTAGNLLSVSTGTWSDSPTSYAYRWQDCTDAFGDGCTDIAGATSSTYTTQASDLGSWIEALVDATNADGTGHSGSYAVGPIGAPTIVGVDYPQLSGDTTRAGNPVTVSPGTWTGSPTFMYQWRLCDAAFTTCSDISGATTTQYTIRPSDLGSQLEAVVTATNTYGAAISDAVTFTPLGAPALVNSSLPSVSGDIGASSNVLTVDTGVWSGSPTYAFQWSRCDANVLNCVAIAGATSSTYQIQDADLGHELRVDVQASNAYGSATSYAFTDGVVGAPAVVDSDFPIMSGDSSSVGNVLMMSDGTWSGSPTITYQWLRCDADGLNCADIASATSDSYTIQAADFAHVVKVILTATNAYGTATWQVQTLQPVGVPEIVGVGSPQITGDLSSAGNSLSVGTGTWTGSPTFTYQWGRCDTGGGNCSDIGGATSSSYTIQAADLGHVLQTTVTATNAAGSATATAQTLDPVGIPEIVGFGFPTLSGDTTAAGKVLSVTDGTWSGSPTITYQWSRCDGAGNSCAAIAGKTAATYTTQAADLGHVLQATVTATGAGGSTSETVQSAAIGAPAQTGYASISGDLTAAGNVLTVDHGTWTGSPTFTYQWQRCAGFTCTDIGGATASTYTTQNADVGDELRAEVTATNANGSKTVFTVTQWAVGVPEIAGFEYPFITGDTSTVGGVLTADTGTWTGSPTFTYVWERCDPSGYPCTPIGGATASTYTTVGADAGKMIEVEVTATNGAGSTTELAQTAFSIGAPTVVGSYPRISGNWSAVGGVLTVSPGEWSGSPLVSYQWYRCNSFDFACTAIPGATSPTYTLSNADLGHSVEADVTASNGTSSSDSPDFVLVGTPSPITSPRITGNVSHVGGVLTVSNGTWNGSPTSFTHTWFRCDADGSGCAVITGATGTTYTIAAADVGKALLVDVGATNATGENFAESLLTGVVGTGAAQHLLTVSTSGSGIVTSDTGGIDCGGTCSAEYADGTTVTLTAAPTTGWAFSGWSGGGCSGTGTCAVTVGADTTVHATFTAVPGPPTVTSFTPTGAGAHETVTVTGTNFTGATQVTLNGMPVAFRVVSATTLTFTVPAGAASGPVAVTTAAGTGTSAFDLTVLPPPTITSIGPGSGPEGTLVTITGTNLGSVVGVEIGHVAVVPTSVSATEVTFVVPPGATSGTITVLSPAGSATSAGTFTVT